MKILLTFCAALLLGLLWLGVKAPHDSYRPESPDCKFVITVHGSQYCASSYSFSGGFVRFEWNGTTWPIREKYIEQIREN